MFEAYRSVTTASRGAGQDFAAMAAAAPRSPLPCATRRPTSSAPNAGSPAARADTGLASAARENPSGSPGSRARRRTSPRASRGWVRAPLETQLRSGDPFLFLGRQIRRMPACLFRTGRRAGLGVHRRRSRGGKKLHARRRLLAESEPELLEETCRRIPLYTRVFKVAIVGPYGDAEC